MGTVANILEDWAQSSPAKASIYASEQGVVVRWFNEAQLQFCDRSECLRDVWEPTVTSTGNVALPSDFLREIKNRVKWDSNTYLIQIDYPTANLVETWSTTTNYSIWNGTFYVWGAAAGSPEIPYIQKPTDITVSTLSSATCEIQTEYQYILKIYLNAMIAERGGDVAGSLALLEKFGQECDRVYTRVVQKLDPVPIMHGGYF